MKRLLILLVAAFSVAGCALPLAGRDGASAREHVPLDGSAEKSPSSAAERAVEAGPEAEETELPRVSLPPVTPRSIGGSPMIVGLDLPAVSEEDFRGAAALFRHVVEVSRARYVMEPGSALPTDVSDSLLGEPVSYPEQARSRAALLPGPKGLMVVDQVPGRAADDLLVEAELAMRSDAHEDALERYEEVNRVEPRLARPWFRRAEAELHLDRIAPAREHLERGISLSPIDPLGHALLAEVFLREGDREMARRAVSRALALYPAYPPVVPLIPAITGSPLHWSPFRPRVRVSIVDRDEILIQADSKNTDAWMAWALCQAATRHEPDRSLVPFDGDRDGLLIRRELLCAFSLADAATGGLRGGDARRESDPAARRIAEIAEAGYLAEFTLYEVIAPRAPGMLLHATPEQHARLAEYIERFVLSPEPSDLP